jgi:peptidoglycan/LPS O-acetylase OafA/YrhL
LLFYGCVFVAIVARSTRNPAHWVLPATAALVAIYVSKDYYVYAPFFLLGALLWYSEHSRHWATTVSLALAAMAIAVSPVVTGRSGLTIAIYVGLMVGCSRLRIPRPWQVIDSRLGDLSYAVYLNHFPVLVAFGAYVEGRGLHFWLAAIAVSIALAAVVHFAVERPLVRVRASIRLQSRQTSALQLK